MAATLVVTAMAAPSSAATVGDTPQPARPYRHGLVAVLGWRPASEPDRRAHATVDNLKYGGGVNGIGVTTGHEKVYLVFYGSQWGSAGTDASGNVTLSGDPQGMAPYLQRIRGRGLTR